MSTQHLEILETTVQRTHQWIGSLAEAAHLDNHTAYQALRAVLQTLRDRLPAPEAAHFAAQLPLLIRGIFYEGYRPSQLPEELSRREFLDRVAGKIVSGRVTDSGTCTTGLPPPRTLYGLRRTGKNREGSARRPEEPASLRIREPPL